MLAAGAYALFSSVFFAFCAYAQLNDPDPEVWALLYLLGGPGLALLSVPAAVLLARQPQSGRENGTALRICKMASTLIRAFEAFALVYLAYLLQSVVQRLDFGASARELAWTFLELEEGREVAGLFMLGAHAHLLLTILRSSLSPHKAAKGKSSTLLTALYGLFVVGILGAAAYAWVLYQPLMNKRYNVEHCNNVFQ